MGCWAEILRDPAGGSPVSGRFVLTGAPGAGKTTIAGGLARLGYRVIPEAATDVIAGLLADGEDETSLGLTFPDVVVELQRTRQLAASPPEDAPGRQPATPAPEVPPGRQQGAPPPPDPSGRRRDTPGDRSPADPPAIRAHVYDRSPLCTLALARYLGMPVSPVLAAEVDRVVREGVYDRRVLFVRLLGFVTPTAARRITYQQSLVFERHHEDVYRTHGFELVEVPPAPVAERVALAHAHLWSWSGR
jgi:predicted ATPase